MIDAMRSDIENCHSRIDELEFEVDELRQENMANKVLISGPAMKDFIAGTVEHRDGIRGLGLHSLHSLRTLVASKSLPESAPPDFALLGDVIDPDRQAECWKHIEKPKPKHCRTW